MGVEIRRGVGTSRGGVPHCLLHTTAEGLSLYENEFLRVEGGRMVRGASISLICLRGTRCHFVRVPASRGIVILWNYLARVLGYSYIMEIICRFATY